MKYEVLGIYLVNFPNNNGRELFGKNYGLKCLIKIKHY